MLAKVLCHHFKMIVPLSQTLLVVINGFIIYYSIFFFWPPTPISTIQPLPPMCKSCVSKFRIADTVDLLHKTAHLSYFQ